MSAAALPPPLTRIPPAIACVADYEAFARERMTPQAWAYLAGGAADEITLRENRAAFDRIRLQARALAEVAGGHTRLTLLGHELDYPIVLAPVAFHKLAHHDGELAAVLGASAMRAPMVVSTQSSVSLEAIAQSAQTVLWFQLYVQPDRGFTRELLRRVEQAGYAAVMVTVDAPIAGVRNREQRAGFVLPPDVQAVNLRGAAAAQARTAVAGESPVFGTGILDGAPTWRDLEWLIAETRLPVLVKGVLAPQDARRAVEAGVAGIAVSNHGGRVLDTVPASIDALPRIAEAVGGARPLLLDGGIRRGTDILKALALGASAVMIGRPYVHGLAAAGAVGVVHVLHLLRAELEAAMVLTGCRTLADVGLELIWRSEEFR